MLQCEKEWVLRRGGASHVGGWWWRWLVYVVSSRWRCCCEEEERRWLKRKSHLQIWMDDEAKTSEKPGATAIGFSPSCFCCFVAVQEREGSSDEVRWRCLNDRPNEQPPCNGSLLSELPRVPRVSFTSYDSNWIYLILKEILSLNLGFYYYSDYYSYNNSGSFSFHFPHGRCEPRVRFSEFVSPMSSNSIKFPKVSFAPEGRLQLSHQEFSSSFIPR